MATAVFGIASTYRQAEVIVEALKRAGFANNDISVLFPDQEGTVDVTREDNTKAPEGAITGAGTGGIVGGALGWLAGIGSLAIPGLGLFVAAGPIVAAVSGAAVGSAVGGLTGALVGMGMAEEDARRYEGKLRNGNILIAVHSDRSPETVGAEDILSRTGAHDISSTTKSGLKDSSSEAGLPHPGLA